MRGLIGNFLWWSVVGLVFASGDVVRNGSETESVDLESRSLQNILQIKSEGKLANIEKTKPSNYFANGLNLEKNLQSIYAMINKINNPQCRTHLLELLKGLTNFEKWALQVVDSVPKIPYGLLYGNMYQLGNFDECIKAHHKNDDIEFNGKYCLADIILSMNNNYSGIITSMKSEKADRGDFNTSVAHWGVCLPSTCNPEDGEIIVKQIITLFIKLEDVDVKIQQNSCAIKDTKLLIKDLIYLVILAVFIFFILLATIFQACIIRNNKLTSYNVSLDQIRSAQSSTLREFVLCFSLINTTKKLFHTNPSELNLECIYGIKILTMISILAGHSLSFIFGSPTENFQFIKEIYGQIENSIFSNSPLLVDTFLFVSGFLICRLLLIELESRKGKINFLFLYIARYIRLTPAYLVIIGFNLTLLRNIGSGPLWNQVAGTEYARCSESWWTNLLYINNYVHTDKLCMFQAWYLSVDFHLFIIAPIFIYPLWRWPKIGLILTNLTIIVSAFIPGYITYINQLDPTILGYPSEMQDISTNYYFNFAYIKTHMRANSYFIGIFFGYLVNYLQTNCIKISDPIRWVLWPLASIIGILTISSIVIFLNPTNQISNVWISFYGPLHRLAWSLVIGWVILSSVVNNSGIVNKLLSWKGFIPFSRLTYCMYLTNGLIIICYKGMMRNPITWTKLNLTFVCLGHLVVTTFIAFLLCICFESPIHGLEKLLLRKSGNSSRSIPSASILPIVEENGMK